MTLISNCANDENGNLRGGKPGDQTGKEWEIRPWYDRPWNVVLRHPAESVGKAIAELAGEAADNEQIGYNQAKRQTFWYQLQMAGYHPADIKIACEADCSSGVAACVRAVGHLYGISAMSEISVNAYTGNLRVMLVSAGFAELTDSKYLTSSDYLLPGDILLYEGHHTAVNLTEGEKARS